MSVRTRRRTGRFALNLALLIALGVGSLYWLGYHTELLGVATGLLGLGGIFAWIAFLSGLVRDERKAELQEWLDDRLASGGVTLGLLALVFILTVTGGLFGSVRIDGRRDTDDRFVEVHDAHGTSSRPVAGDVFSARSVRTFPVFVGWRQRRYELRVDGLPRLLVEVGPYRRRMVVSPDAFLARNIVLMRPTTDISQTALNASEPYQLTVRVGTDQKIVLHDYRGETVWIGCDGTVAIPGALRERWRLDLVARNIAEARMVPWLSPRAVAEQRVLRAGERIRFEIGYPGQRPWVEHEAAVTECGSPDCFPQEVVIDAP